MVFTVIMAVIGFSLVSCEDEPETEHVHQWGEWTVTTAATCTAAGVETRVCTLDPSHEETRAIAINPNAHNWGSAFLGGGRAANL